MLLPRAFQVSMFAISVFRLFRRSQKSSGPYAVSIGDIAFTLIVDISQFGSRIEPTELRLRGDRTEEPRLNAEYPVDDRLQIVTS